LIYVNIEFEKNRVSIVIILKARNKFYELDKLNTRYNLGTCAYKKAKVAELNIMM
jgi:hypothetical protein